MVCLRRISLLLPFCFLLSLVAGSAQLQPEPSDPLTRIRDAAKNNVQACSATGETLCEQVAPKIVANAEGDSPLEANLRRLREAEAVVAFRDAKLDVHTEKQPQPAAPSEAQEGGDVVAEIRGREKPDEWVLLGDSARCRYSASSVIQAARAIQLTGVHPRRSIRFVIFDGDGLHYVRAHRDELDRASAVIILCAATNPVTGFVLNGRHDIEPGVKETLEPIYPMGVTHHTFDAPFERRSLYFILEGIPTLLIPAAESNRQPSTSGLVGATSPDKAEIGELKRNIAIVAVAAFDIAERAEPLGPRQSHAEIESLLKATGLDEQMKAAGVWPSWESGQLGRLP